MYRTALRRHLHVAMMLAVALPVLVVGCEDKAERFKPKADAALEHLRPLTERDVKQVRVGLPQGAAKLGEMLDQDPSADLEGVRRAIKRARASVPDLAVAKSTFFLVVDPSGTVLRAEADPDLAAQASLTKAIPEVSRALEPRAGLVEAFGTMHELRGAEKGNDMQWVVGFPITDAGGKVKGAFVTGWSFRAYAYYLEEEIRRHLSQTAEDPLRGPPLCYVFLVRGKDAFGAPVTPDVNAEALGKLDIPSKVAGGAFHAVVAVADHRFLIVAKPFAALGEGTAVALMISVR